LELLMRNSGRVISRQQILRDVWNTDWSGSTKNLDMHVSALRRKLGEEGEHISTIRGLGFRFDRS
jgi:DNA-binding response OmpR family regulator